MRSRWLNYRMVIFAIATLFSIFFSLPTIFPNLKGNKITLGLDLQGGVHMMLGVQTHEAIASRITSIASNIKYFTDKQNVYIDGLKILPTSISFKLLDKSEMGSIENMLKDIKGIVVNRDDVLFNISLTQEEQELIAEQAILQAIETIRNRLDQFGLAEPSVARAGDDKIAVELPGIKTQQEEQRARELIAKAAHLQLMAVDEDRSSKVYTMTNKEAQSYGDVIFLDSKDENKKHLLRSIPVLDGSMLVDAKVAYDQNNQVVINFELNTQGAKIFADFTEKNIGKRLAVVLDEKVYSDPVIRGRIAGGSGQISGSFTPEEAHDVAIALRSGSLLAPVKLLEKRTIGPSLGEESIKASIMALVIGSGVLVIFLIMYYGISGIITNLAIVVNLLMVIAFMATFGATLTLPGMAGIVLLIGMAVDANVIINERIRELLRSGESIQKSIEHGYDNAMSAILDANITTLIVAVALYAYGTGPVKGFALTLGIGISASMLTAILGTHGIYDALMNKIEKSRNLALWFGLKGVK